MDEKEFKKKTRKFALEDALVNRTLPLLGLCMIAPTIRNFFINGASNWDYFQAFIVLGFYYSLGEFRVSKNNEFVKYRKKLRNAVGFYL